MCGYEGSERRRDYIKSTKNPVSSFINHKRKIVIIIFILMFSAHFIFVGLIGSHIITINEDRASLNWLIGDIHRVSFEERLRMNNELTKTVDNAWRGFSWDYAIGDWEDIWDRFIERIASRITGIDGESLVLVIKRDTGDILFPYEYEGKTIDVLLDKWFDNDILRVGTLTSILASRDILYPSYMVTGSEDNPAITFECLTVFPRCEFGEEDRLFWNKVVLPHPYSRYPEIAVLVGFSEDTITEPYFTKASEIHSLIANLDNQLSIFILYIIGILVSISIFGVILIYQIKQLFHTSVTEGVKSLNGKSQE